MKAHILSEKMRGYPIFPFRILIALANTCFFHSHNLRKNIVVLGRKFLEYPKRSHRLYLIINGLYVAITITGNSNNNNNNNNNNNDKLY